MIIPNIIYFINKKQMQMQMQMGKRPEIQARLKV
jgi:hypothetical protein